MSAQRKRRSKILNSTQSNIFPKLSVTCGTSSTPGLTFRLEVDGGDIEIRF